MEWTRRRLKYQNAGKLKISLKSWAEVTGQPILKEVDSQLAQAVYTV